MLRVASGTEYKLHEAPRVDMGKVEAEWAGIVRGPGPPLDGADPSACDDVEAVEEINFALLG